MYTATDTIAMRTFYTGARKEQILVMREEFEGGFFAFEVLRFLEEFFTKRLKQN